MAAAKSSIGGADEVHMAGRPVLTYLPNLSFREMSASIENRPPFDGDIAKLCCAV